MAGRMAACTGGELGHAEDGTRITASAWDTRICLTEIVRLLPLSDGRGTVDRLYSERWPCSSGGDGTVAATTGHAIEALGIRPMWRQLVGNAGGALTAHRTALSVVTALLLDIPVRSLAESRMAYGQSCIHDGS